MAINFFRFRHQTMKPHLHISVLVIAVISTCYSVVEHATKTVFESVAEPHSCTKAFDVAFLLDSSSDVDEMSWNGSINLVSEVISGLRPSVSGTHVSVIHFSRTATVVQPLGGQVAALNRSRSVVGKGRNMTEAWRVTRRSVFNGQRGDRPEVPDVIVLVSHGVSDDRNQSVLEARRLREEDGVRIIAVGIGVDGAVDKLKEELEELASDPDETQQLFVVNRHYYATVLRLLLQSICSKDLDIAEGSLRMFDQGDASGRLEVYVRREWTTVCADKWSTVNTDVVCRSLGFPRGVSWFTDDKVLSLCRAGLAGVACTGNESSLLDCRHGAFFHVPSSCDRRRDVFVRCLCSDCDDYRARDNLRLAAGSTIAGRLEVFSPERMWRGVCSAGWSPLNTRVACRQLGFLDGAGIYTSASDRVAVVLKDVDCVGEERSLFACNYSTDTAADCSSPVHIRCRCSTCKSVLLKHPAVQHAYLDSEVAFEWLFREDYNDTVEVWFQSSKNPQLILRRRGGALDLANTAFKTRVQMKGHNGTAFGFTLRNITRGDMGVYALHLPRHKLFNSDATLFVTDFASVPDSVVHSHVNDSLLMRWDFTALRRFAEISHEVFLTTPATGRLPLDYYNAHWLPDNPARHGISATTDNLSPTVKIDRLRTEDAGNYVMELRVTSLSYRWLNASWRYESRLVVGNWRRETTSVDVSLILNITLGVVVFLTMLMIVRLCCSRKTVKQEDRHLQGGPEYQRPQNSTLLPPYRPLTSSSHQKGRYRDDRLPGQNQNTVADDYENTIYHG